MSRLPGKERVVFDCNIFVQAIAFEHGPAAAALRLVEEGVIELFVSKAVLAELRRVLGYEEVRAMSASMTPTLIEAFLQRLTYRATLRKRVPRVFEYARDPDDEPYLDLAVSVKADLGQPAHRVAEDLLPARADLDKLGIARGKAADPGDRQLVHSVGEQIDRRAHRHVRVPHMRGYGTRSRRLRLTRPWPPGDRAPGPMPARAALPSRRPTVISSLRSGAAPRGRRQRRNRSWRKS